MPIAGPEERDARISDTSATLGLRALTWYLVDRGLEPTGVDPCRPLSTVGSGEAQRVGGPAICTSAVRQFVSGWLDPGWLDPGWLDSGLVGDDDGLDPGRRLRFAMAFWSDPMDFASYFEAQRACLPPAPSTALKLSDPGVAEGLVGVRVSMSWRVVNTMW